MFMDLPTIQRLTPSIREFTRIGECQLKPYSGSIAGRICVLGGGGDESLVATARHHPRPRRRERRQRRIRGDVDNLSGLPPWLSDTLCRLTSGGAFSTRRLFTDQDEILFAAARPIILNGIEEVITRPDLADRAILLMLAPIAERQRRPETALWREFELARPHILGALLNAAAHGLHMLPQVRLQRLPRMADFALWATACESAFRLAGTRETAYSNNRRDAIENIVDADPVAAHVRELMADRAQWTGSASDLLQVGINVGGNAMAAWTRSGWPKSPRALAGRLRRAQPFLRTLGIEIVFGREGRLGTRTIRITAMGENRTHDTVSTVSRVSDHEDRAGLIPGPKIVTLGRLPSRGESDLRWRTEEVRHVGSDTVTPGF